MQHQFVEETFHDYTLATNLERFVAVLEQTFRGWLFTGLENISHMAPTPGPDKRPSSLVRVVNRLQHKLPYRTGQYTCSLYVPYTREADLAAAKAAQAAQQAKTRQQRQQQQVVAGQQHDSARAPQPAAKQLPSCSSQQPNRQPEAPTASQGATPAAPAVGSAPQQLSGVVAGRATEQRHLAAAATSLTGVSTVALQQEGGAAIAPTAEPSAGAGAQQQQQQAGQALTAAAQGQVQQQAAAVATAAAPAGVEVTEQVVDDLLQRYRELQEQLLLQEQEQQQQQQAAEQEEAAVKLEAEGADKTNPQQQQQQQQQTAKQVPLEQQQGRAGRPAEPSNASSHLEPVDSEGAADVSDALQLGNIHLLLSQPSTASSLSLVTADSAALSDGSGPGLQTTASDASVTSPVTLVTSGEPSGVASGQRAGGAGQGPAAAAAAAADVALRQQAVARIKAAMQQDQSSSAANRSWWPHHHPLAHIYSSSSTTTTTTATRPPWWGAGASYGHKLQRLFGIDHFAMLQPESYSGRVLDVNEATTLASAAALAVAGTGVSWPVLLPVHDALRDAYIGVASAAGRRVMMRTDSVHISRPPTALTTPQAQLQLLAAQLQPSAPAAAAACLAAAGQPSSTNSSSSSSASGVSCWMSASYSYDWPVEGAAGAASVNEAGSEAGSDSNSTSAAAALATAGDDWDATAPWYRWGHQRDPVGAIELDLVWEWRRLQPTGSGSSSSSSSSSERHSSGGPSRHSHGGLQPSSSSVEQLPGSRPGDSKAGMTAEEAALMFSSNCAATADLWLLHVLERGYRSVPRREGTLGTAAPERYRRYVSLHRAGPDALWSADLAARAAVSGTLSGAYPQPSSYNPRRLKSAATAAPGVLTVMLSALLTAYTAAAVAEAEGGELHDLSGPDFWESRGEMPPPAPPDSVMTAVLRDLLQPQHPATASQQGPAKDYTLVMAHSAGGNITRSQSHGSGGSSSTVQWQDAQPQQQWYSGDADDLNSSSSSSGQDPGSTTTSSSSSGAASSAAGSCQLPGSAPAGSLLSRLAMHCAVYGNARAVSILWKRFVTALRLQHWEGSALLPRMPATALLTGSLTSCHPAGAAAAAQGGLGGPPSPDLEACLLQQKLQMLNVCIFRAGSQHISRVAAQPAYNRQPPQQQQQVQGRAADADAGSSVDGSSEYASVSGDGVLEQEGGEEQPTAEELPAAAAAAAAGQVNSLELPLGVAGPWVGHHLLQHPDRTVNLPLLQQPPCYTSDQLQQQQAAMVALAEAAAAAAAPGGGPSATTGGAAEAPQPPAAAAGGVVGEEASAGGTAAAAGVVEDVPSTLLMQHKLTSAALISDMSAFKAANPGAVLEDFLNWHNSTTTTTNGSHPTATDSSTGVATNSSSSSSKNSQQQLLAGQTAASSPWQQLWRLAPPQPASEQKPLLHPQREGEAVLHYLETLSPLQLLSQLVCVAVAEAARLLMSSDAAQLPAVAGVVERFQTQAGSVLRRCSSSSSSAAAAQGGGGGGGVELAWDGGAGGSPGAGWAEAELELLLSEFMYLEQVVVLGQSLLVKLQGHTALAARVLQHLLEGMDPAAAFYSNNSTSSGADGPDGTGGGGAAGGGGEEPQAGSGSSASSAIAPDISRQTFQQQQQQQWSSICQPCESSQATSGSSSRSWVHLPCAQVLPCEREQLLQQVAQRQPFLSSTGAGSSSSSSTVYSGCSVPGLGLPLQKEWVLLAGQTPGTTAGVDQAGAQVGASFGHSTAPSSSRGTQASTGRSSSSSSSSNSSPAVVTGSVGSGVVPPPSRLYLQEASGEMRLAVTLVSEPGT